MNIKNLTLILFLLISAKGLCQKTDLDKRIKGSTYTIKYSSSDWKFEKTEKSGSDFFLFNTTVPGKFGNNINLLIQNLKGMNLDLDSYTKISEDQINSNGKLISSKRKLTNNVEYQELLYTATYNSYKAKFYQHYYIKDNKAYVLTFTALNSEFENLFKEASKIMNTFKFN